MMMINFIEWYCHILLLVSYLVNLKVNLSLKLIQDIWELFQTNMVSDVATVLNNVVSKSLQIKHYVLYFFFLINFQQYLIKRKYL